MTEKDYFNSLTEQLHIKALEKFKLTKQYKLLEEKLNRMKCDCEAMFTKDEREFAEECFELLSSVGEQQEKYIYQSGLLDSVYILKTLGVLA